MGRAVACDLGASSGLYGDSLCRTGSGDSPFTPASMYPQLWQASGLPYADLIDELVRLAVDRHEHRSRFSTKR